jgi:hypothetical protein
MKEARWNMDGHPYSGSLIEDPKTEAKLVNLDFYSETEQTISRMEKLVSELKVRVEQDDAVMDAGYRLRIQTLAALLMSLITARPTHQLSRRM